MKTQKSKSNCCAWCLIALLLVIFAIFVVLRYHKDVDFILNGPSFQSNACELKNYSEMVTRTKSRANNESKILVNLEGHIQIEQEQHDTAGDSYLPMELKAVWQNDGLNGEKLLNLLLECAKIVVRFASTERELIVGSMDIEVIHRRNGKLFKNDCSILSTPIVLKAPIDYYYSCRFSIDFPCLTRHWNTKMDSFVMEKFASLRFDRFDFELDGDSSLIRTGVFSKKQHKCAFSLK